MKNILIYLTVFLVLLFVAIDAPCRAQSVKAWEKETAKSETVVYEGNMPIDYGEPTKDTVVPDFISPWGGNPYLKSCRRRLVFYPDGSLMVYDSYFIETFFACDACNFRGATLYGTWKVKRGSIFITSLNKEGWNCPYEKECEMPKRLLLDSLGNLKSANNPLVVFGRRK